MGVNNPNRKQMMNKFLVRWRCDQEEYFCTESVEINSSASSVLNFIEEQKNELAVISSRNTIIEIKRIDI